MASLTDDARKKANLRVLQRSDHAVLDIVGSASHVVLYEFQNEWTKSNVEGSLFLVKRSEAPRFQLVVLNRASVDNWSLPLTATFQMQHEAPFLIFRLKENNNQQVMIRGIWFHDETERSDMFSLLERVVQSLQHVADLEKKHKPLQELTTTTTTPSKSEAVPNEAPDPTPFLLTPLSLNEQPGTITATTQPQAQQPPQSQQPPAGQAQQQPLVLDKKSLQLSLLSLIQDERFLDLIHAQYLKVAHARANRAKSLPSNNTKE